MVTLDVLIPHYNDASGLDVSLKSIEVQSWRGEYRVVVYDDGSDSIVIEELNRIINESSLNIELVVGGKNLGRPFARNKLIENIESEYVAWLDAGDEWYPDKIEKQFEALYRAFYLQDSRLILVTCNYDWQWNNGKKRKRNQVTDGNQLKSLLIGKDLRAYLWTLMGSAEVFKAIGKFDENLPRLQDLDYFIRFVEKGGKLVGAFSSQPLCVYHKSDIGRDSTEIKKCFQYIMKKHSYAYHQFSSKFRRHRRYELEKHSARFALNNRNYGKVLLMILKSFFTMPLFFIYELIKNKGVKL